MEAEDGLPRSESFTSLYQAEILLLPQKRICPSMPNTEFVPPLLDKSVIIAPTVVRSRTSERKRIALYAVAGNPFSALV